MKTADEFIDELKLKLQMIQFVSINIKFPSRGKDKRFICQDILDEIEKFQKEKKQ